MCAGYKMRKGRNIHWKFYGKRKGVKRLNLRFNSFLEIEYRCRTMKRDAKYDSGMFRLLWRDEVSKMREKLKPKLSTTTLTASSGSNPEVPATSSEPHGSNPELPTTSSDLLGPDPEVPVTGRKFRSNQASAAKLSFSEVPDLVRKFRKSWFSCVKFEFCHVFGSSESHPEVPEYTDYTQRLFLGRWPINTPSPPPSFAAAPIYEIHHLEPPKHLSHSILSFS